MLRSYPYVSSNTSQEGSITIYGDTEREKCTYDIWSVCELEIQIWEPSFWCRGYFVDTVGRNKTAIQKYIQNQLSEDKTVDQISMKEFIDPFTGEPTEKGDK